MRVACWLLLTLAACDARTERIEPPHSVEPVIEAPTIEAPLVRHDMGDDWYISDASIAACERMLRDPSVGQPLARFRLLRARSKLYDGRAEEAALEIDALLTDLESGGEPATPAFRIEVLRELAAAWLRVGELGNCILHHGTDSCLLPISKSGQHADPKGSRNAMAALRKLLLERPTDLEARWLLNVAAMTVGEWPDGVPAELRVPPSAFSSEGEVGRLRDVAAACGLADRQLAGGVCLDDFDGDGLLDVVTSEFKSDRPLRYYRNAGDGAFTERSAEAGFLGITGGLNLLHADVDNDGSPDILVLRTEWKPELAAEWPLTLLLNDGRGIFRDATATAGLHGTFSTRTAAFADYDGDGWLDLFVGNESTNRVSRSSQLFHSNGDGTFSEASAAVGLNLTAHVRGCAWGDADGDGDPELVVTSRDAPPLLFRNDDGRFVEIAERAGITGPPRGYGCWWFDYDNDGHLDLFVAGYRLGQTTAVCADYLGAPARDVTPRLYRNRGDGTFDDVTVPMGLLRVLPAMGCNVGDIDNDGWPDFYLGTGEPDLCAIYPNRLFRNDGGRRFLDVTTSAGMGHLQKGDAVAFGDLDNDGDQDVLEIMGGFLHADSFHRVLFDNPGHGGRWVTLLLEGVAANRSAIGARLRVHVRRPDGTVRDIYHLVGTGASVGSQSLQAELGLGDAEAIEWIEIRWPGSDTQQVVSSVPLDACSRVVEGHEAMRVERAAFRLGAR